MKICVIHVSVSLRKLETSTMIVSVPSELSQWRHKCGFRRSIQKHSRGLKFPSCHCNSVEWSSCLAHESCFVECVLLSPLLVDMYYWSNGFGFLFPVCFRCSLVLPKVYRKAFSPEADAVDFLPSKTTSQIKFCCLWFTRPVIFFHSSGRQNKDPS